ncbi:MAG: ATP-binding protein [Cellulomonas sp.]
MPDNPDDVTQAVERILALGRETEWIEFKVNNGDPEMIGEYISALGNSAALEGRRRAYLVWGVRDDDLEVVGTAFEPNNAKVSGEELNNHLLRQLQPQVYFSFKEVQYRGANLVVLEIEPPTERPIRFRDTEFIRIGSYKKKLRDHPDHERRLWRLFDNEGFEKAAALDHLSVEQVIQLLDYPTYFSQNDLPLPETRSLIIESLEREGYLRHDVETAWTITNVGALLLARDLRRFPGLARKAPRVVVYDGSSRVRTLREQEGQRGYAAGFGGLLGHISDLLPENEAIKGATRRTETLYPQLAIRELLANALIHQDLAMPGTGPTIEIFDDRIEFTNPGIPLVNPDRFIDSPPQSRNERLARAMRQMGLCEERGSGWDKVTFEIEYNQLPPALVEVTEAHTRVVIFAPRPLREMDRDERFRALYQHACLQYVNRKPMTNSTVRARFGMSDRQTVQASRLLREAQDAGLIALYDPTVGPKAMRYVPFWADPQRRSLA